MIRPLHNRVIVQRFDTAVDKIGMIYIPASAKERPNQGDVIGVGPGRRLPSGERVPLLVKVGDKILFGKYSGSEVMVEGRELLVVQEEDIMGVME